MTLLFNRPLQGRTLFHFSYEFFEDDPSLRFRLSIHIFKASLTILI